MRRAATLAALVGWILAGSVPATGTWGESVTVSGGTVGTGSLVAVPLGCVEETVLVVVDAAKVTWTPSAQPAALTYSAEVVESGQPVQVDANSSATVLPSLFGAGLFGRTVTVRVTGRLGTTGWRVTSDRTVYVGPAGTSVNCSSP